MADEAPDKTFLQKSRDIISQLKDMSHHSKTSITKLTEFWLILSDELKLKEMATRVEGVLSQQNALQESLDKLVEDYEIECNRIEQEGK